MHAHKTVDSISTYSLIQDMMSVCSLDIQGTFPLLYSRKMYALSGAYLLTAFHNPIDGLAARFLRLAKSFHVFGRLFHPIPSQR